MIVVLTYDAPHRKTQDLLFRLVAKGYKNILVAATPWQERPAFKALIRHRPTEAIPIPLREFCKSLGYPFQVVRAEELFSFLLQEGGEPVLIAGAGILSKEVIERRKVINAHPGHLPVVRGLDAFKWAVYEDLPIGVTTHVVSEEADAGFLIRQQLVPVDRWDSFHSVATRQYEMEIAMLADAVEDLKKAALTPLDDRRYPVRRRMPHEKEKELFARFQKLVEKSNKG